MSPGKNFVESYTAWAESFTDAPVSFHHLAGYWVLSALVGRRVYLHLGDNRLFPNLWLVILAPSSFYRKSTALSIGSKIVNAVNPGLMLPSEWTHECLLAIMKDQPQGAMVCYEFKRLLALLQKDYNFGAQSLLTELYDCPPDYSRKKGTTEIKEFHIERPYLTILGASTLEWLLASVQSGDIAGGFLARFLFLSADHKDKILAIQPKADQAEKERVIEMARAAIGVDGEMRYSPEAISYYESWYHRFFKEADAAPETVRAFFPRLTDYSHKFAMIEAVQNGHHPEITVEDCRRACLMADTFAAEIRKLGADSLGKSKFDAMKTRVLAAIRRYHGIEHSKLLRNTSISAKVFKEIIETLRQSGEIDIRESGYFPIERAEEAFR